MITVISYFSVAVIITVNWCLFFSYYWISVKVTINWNNTAGVPINKEPVWLFYTKNSARGILYSGKSIHE